MRLDVCREYSICASEKFAIWRQKSSEYTTIYRSIVRQIEVYFTATFSSKYTSMRPDCILNCYVISDKIQTVSPSIYTDEVPVEYAKELAEYVEKF